MSDIEMHFRKILDMSNFRLSKEFNYLSEASKIKFISKYKYHAHMIAKLFIGILTPAFETIWSALKGISRVITTIIQGAKNAISMILEKHAQTL